MAECRAMVGPRLDQRSIDTLERINNKHAWGSALTTVLSAGVFSSIFTKSPAAQAAFNITQTDWDLYARAMLSVPVITKAAIQKGCNS